MITKKKLIVKEKITSLAFFFELDRSRPLVNIAQETASNKSFIKISICYSTTSQYSDYIVMETELTLSLINGNSTGAPILLIVLDQHRRVIHP